MIYEVAYVARTDASETELAQLKQTIADTLTEYSCTTHVNDSWGVKTFAQPTDSGIKKGHYLYCMYQGNGKVNAELERKFRINESVIKFLIVKLGEDKKQADIVKNYKNPNTSKVETNEDEGYGGGDDKEKKMHSKKRSCWFSAKKTGPDWKDPKTYSWLVNEFGKISPGRITGLTPSFQRKSNDAIKRGRMMGLISYLSNNTAH
jgi:small subunit ribosomal protein S6